MPGKYTCDMRTDESECDSTQIFGFILPPQSRTYPSETALQTSAKILLSALPNTQPVLLYLPQQCSPWFAVGNAGACPETWAGSPQDPKATKECPKDLHCSCSRATAPLPCELLDIVTLRAQGKRTSTPSSIRSFAFLVPCCKMVFVAQYCSSGQVWLIWRLICARVGLKLVSQLQCKVTKHISKQGRELHRGPLNSDR